MVYVSAEVRALLDAVTEEVGGGRTGLRLSPFSPANGISDADPQPLFEHVVAGLNRYGLAYVHVIEGATGGTRDFLEENGISATKINKVREGRPHIEDAIRNRQVQLVFNTTSNDKTISDSKSLCDKIRNGQSGLGDDPG